MNQQEAREIISGIINGSAEIDIMKKEIDCVVKTVLGFIKLNCDWKDGEKANLPLEDFFWEIVKEKGEFQIRFSKVLQSKPSTLSFIYVISSKSRSRGSIGIFYVQTVYDSLPDFIIWIRKIFPFLDQSWKPLLESRIVQSVEK